MLNDLPRLIKAKDVNARPVFVGVCWPDLMTMQNDQVTLCDRALVDDFLPGILPRHSLEVIDEEFLSISNVRIVLPVSRTYELRDSVTRFAVVEHHVVERHGVAAILYGVRWNWIHKNVGLGKWGEFNA